MNTYLLREALIQNPCHGFRRNNNSQIVKKEYYALKQMILSALSYHHDSEDNSIPLIAVKSSLEKLISRQLISPEMIDVARSYAATGKITGFDRMSLVLDLLYVDRGQFEELMKSFYSNGITLLQGLTGEGKSCLLLKYFHYLRHEKEYFPVFIDFKKETKFYTKYGEHSTDVESDTYTRNKPRDEEFEKFVVAEMVKACEKHINLAKLLWPMTTDNLETKKNSVCYKYAMLMHNQYRQWFIDYIFNTHGVLISDIRDFIECTELNLLYDLIKDFEREVLIKEGCISNSTLEGYLEFFYLLGVKPVFLIDNIDRFTLYRQQQVFTLCIDLRNYENINPRVIIAIREQNIARITHSSKHSDIFEKVILKSLTNTRTIKSTDPHDESEEVHEIVVKTIERRLWVLYYSIGVELAKKISISTEPTVIDATKQFIEEFVKNIGVLLKENIGIGYYKLCNRSLRTFPTEFARQMLRMQFGPESEYYVNLWKEYQINKEKGIVGGEVRTKLNTFYYKLLLSRWYCDPSFEVGLINIFNSDKLPICMDFLILDYLARQSQIEKIGTANGSSQSIRIIKDDLYRFADFNERSIVDYSMIKLQKEYITWADLSGFIENHSMFDVYNQDQVDQGKSIPREQLVSYYGMLPSGQYFIEKLCISCEYAFWSILNTPVALEERNAVVDCAHFDESNYDTIMRNPIIKIRLLRAFIHSILYPRYVKFVELYERINPDIPIQSAIDKYCFNGLPYPIRLTTSIYSWLDFAQVPNDADRHNERNNILAIEMNYLKLFGISLKEYSELYYGKAKKTRYDNILKDGNTYLQ